jgi:hypothetical protein
MSRPSIRIHDLLTDEVIDREMTVAEFKQHEADQLAIETIANEAKAKETAKTEILTRLGLTADELKTILG